MPITLDSSGYQSAINTVTGPTAAPATGRGFMVQLGKATGVDLNTAAQTTIFTAAATGFTRFVVTRVIVDNISMAATTASVSYGATGTPTDWAGTATMAGATTNVAVILTAAAAATPTYAPGTVFVANVTIPQGVAATCDIAAWGYYE